MGQGMASIQSWCNLDGSYQPSNLRVKTQARAIIGLIHYNLKNTLERWIRNCSIIRVEGGPASPCVTYISAK